MHTMEAGIEAFIDGLGDFIGWVLAGVATLMIVTGRWMVRSITDAKDDVEGLEEDVRELAEHQREHKERIESNQERLDEMHRFMVGPEADPGNVGLLEGVHDLDKKVDELNEKMDRYHEDAANASDDD